MIRLDLAVFRRALVSLARSGDFVKRSGGRARFASYPPDTVAMMWGSAWKTDRVNAQPHLRASRRVRTLGDVELLARRMVEEHWMAISRVAKVLAAAGELSGIELEAHWREEGILRRTPCSPAEVS